MSEQLVAGVETDLAVAKACGFDAYVRDYPPEGPFLGDKVCYVRDRGIFKPSTHSCSGLIAAAEFTKPSEASPRGMTLILEYDPIHGSSARFSCNKWDRETEPAEAETPELAICAAILKLAENKPVGGKNN